MKVRDKKIIVTGAGAGIGREISLQLLAKGAYVIGLDINEDKLKETRSISKNGERFSFDIVDLSKQELIDKFYKEYFNKYEYIDGIINNAGIIQPFKNVDKLEMDAIDRVMGVNFYGPLTLTKLFLPDLLKREEAHIVNISSMGGFFPFPGQTIYGASKAALKLFTEGLYAEYYKTGLKITIVFPGVIETDIVKNSKIDMNLSADGSKYRLTSPKKAAFEIIKGMEKDKFQIYIGLDSKLMNFFYNLNAKAVIKFIDKKMSNLKK